MKNKEMIDKATRKGQSNIEAPLTSLNMLHSAQLVTDDSLQMLSAASYSFCHFID